MIRYLDYKILLGQPYVWNGDPYNPNRIYYSGIKLQLGQYRKADAAFKNAVQKCNLGNWKRAPIELNHIPIHFYTIAIHRAAAISDAEEESVDFRYLIPSGAG